MTHVNYLTYPDGLFKFRKERGLENELGDVVTNILEEIVEARKEHRVHNTIKLIGELTDVCVYCENALAALNEPVDALDFIIDKITVDRVLIDITMDIARYDRDQSPHIFRHIHRKIKLLIESIGFDFNKCMMETVKKINSRKGAINTKTGKWEKSKTQDPYELYSPKYSVCTIIK